LLELPSSDEWRFDSAFQAEGVTPFFFDDEVSENESATFGQGSFQPRQIPSINKTGSVILTRPFF
jgi:hypothetical protein